MLIYMEIAAIIVQIVGIGVLLMLAMLGKKAVIYLEKSEKSATKPVLERVADCEKQVSRFEANLSDMEAGLDVRLKRLNGRLQAMIPSETKEETNGEQEELTDEQLLLQQLQEYGGNAVPEQPTSPSERLRRMREGR